MQELVSSLKGAVVFSDRALRQLARVNAARHDHLQTQGREPSTRDLAILTGLPPAQVTQLVGAAQPRQDFDERADVERPRAHSLAESLRDPAPEDAFEHATLRVAADALPAVLATLTPRELAIVRARFGMRKLRDACDRVERRSNDSGGRAPSGAQAPEFDACASWKHDRGDCVPAVQRQSQPGSSSARSEFRRSTARAPSTDRREAGPSSLVASS
jgi:hypothetical protein